MLLTCPECELQVSDKAITCPHCGYPMQENIKPRKPRSNKRRRLPNGFGQISEIKGRNLRKPFRAMVTSGVREDGKPICRPLKPESYFETYNEAYAALIEYNRNPCTLDANITVEELHDRWFERYSKNTRNSNLKGAWNYCSAIAKMRVIDLRARHIKCCIDEGTAEIRGQRRSPTANTKYSIKLMFNMMLDYAVEYEIVDKNYARTFTLDKEVTKEQKKIHAEHIPYTDEEISILWEHVDDTPYVDMLLIQCYSGWRPQELCLLETKNINLENGSFIGGMKTENGKNRIVPIHSKIRHLVERQYYKAKECNSKYLFMHCKKPSPDMVLSYNQYAYVFRLLCDRLNLNKSHRPHDGRVHFVTKAKKYKMDEYAIKYIVGHAISDITEKTYTMRELSWLSEEIEKIS